MHVIFWRACCRGSTPTPPPPTPIPATPTPVIPTPAYIPAACQNQPLATVPAATALAEPTPFLLDNPEVPPDLQLRVFNDAANVIEDVYVYPDFNGVDWEGRKKTYREKIEAGLDTKTFYETMQAFIAELNDDHSHFESPVEVAMSEAQLAGTDEFVGIGAFILPFEEKGHVTLIYTYPDSPAEHAGLKAHDSILAADGLPIIQDGEARIEIVRGTGMLGSGAHRPVAGRSAASRDGRPRADSKPDGDPVQPPAHVRRFARRLYLPAHLLRSDHPRPGANRARKLRSAGRLDFGQPPQRRRQQQCGGTFAFLFRVWQAGQFHQPQGIQSAHD
ncbi:MAG: hypothetical protein HND47_23845 [Chloroflexi bacterium]|nr:hypothetical protein [Chloroflexota bacterium]